MLIIDELLTSLDQALPSFPFPVEGLDLTGPSGFKPLPENAVIVSDFIHCKLCRTTRFHYTQLHWSADKGVPSQLDQRFQALADTLKSMVGNGSQTPAFKVVEKYDIDPRDYANLAGRKRQKRVE